jgi:hypothetical protein
MSLIVKRHHRFEDGSVLIAGDELKPNSLDQLTINTLLDADILTEVPTRLSYYQLLPDFAGVSDVSSADRSHPFPGLTIPATRL